MNILVIGGTGHIGQHLVPLLVAHAHEVTVVTRGKHAPPATEPWGAVHIAVADSATAAGLQALRKLRPEVVIDIPGTARHTCDAFRGIAAHIVAVGSVWMFGKPKVVPTPEETQGPCPFAGYAHRYADLCDLLQTSGTDGTVFTAIMPPNIAGPGKIPLDCLGGRSLDLHRGYARGAEVVLPDGPDALVGPCDAEDIARCLALAVELRTEAAGQMFNVGAAAALTWTGIVAAYGQIYGVRLPLRRVSWHVYVKTVSPDIGSWWHMKAHMCPDIGKARRRLGYEPRYTPQQTLARAVDWMRAEGLL